MINLNKQTPRGVYQLIQTRQQCFIILSLFNLIYCILFIILFVVLPLKIRSFVVVLFGLFFISHLSPVSSLLSHF